MGRLVPFTHSKRKAILCAKRLPKALSWILGSAPPNPLGFSTGPGCEWNWWCGRGSTSPGACRGYACSQSQSPKGHYSLVRVVSTMGLLISFLLFTLRLTEKTEIL